MKKFVNAALNWQPFVITIKPGKWFCTNSNTKKELRQETAGKNVLPLTTIENTLIFPGWKKVLGLALQILDSREGLGLERWCFQCLEVASFWLLDWVYTHFQECLCLESTSCLWWWKVWTEKINQNLGLSCSMHNIFSSWMWFRSQETIQIVFRSWNVSFNCKQTRDQFYLIFTYFSEVQKCYALKMFFIFYFLHSS